MYAFYFRRNTLYWVDNKGINEVINWMVPQLNKKFPPDINEENIQYITIREKYVDIYTQKHMWVLCYEGIPGEWKVTRLK